MTTTRCPCLTGGPCTLPPVTASRWPDNDARLARMYGAPVIAAGESKKVRTEQQAEERRKGGAG